MFFDDWDGLWRVLVVGMCACLSLVVLPCASGKRTLAKLSALDVLVTVALCATLATVLLSSDVALLEGVLAMALLVVLQYIAAWPSVRSRGVERLAKSEPTPLYRDRLIRGRVRTERVTEDEIRQAARADGRTGLEEVAAVVLETGGSQSILSGAPRSLRSPEAESRRGPDA